MKRLQINQLERIRLKLDGKPHEYPAQVLDLNPLTFVVRVPEMLASLEGPSAVRLLIGQKSYTWEADAEVLAHYEDWWFIRRPRDEDFVTTQQRQSVRILYKEDMIAIPVDARGLPTADPAEIKIRNLSASGCYGFMYKHLANGEHVMLILSLPNVPIISVIARVVRVQKKVEQGGWYGLLFETMTEAEKEKMARFIHAQIQAKLKQGVDITLDNG